MPFGYTHTTIVEAEPVSAIVAYDVPVLQAESPQSLGVSEVVKIKEIEPHETELCNCYLHVRNNVVGVGTMASMVPNTGAAVGVVAVEWFGTIKHVSIVIEVREDGVVVSETNYIHCQAGTRFIPYSKPSLIGFWSA